MIYIYIFLLAGICGAIGQYLDKHLVNIGITRKDYFYYMCLSMIPFSIIMLLIEYISRGKGIIAIPTEHTEEFKDFLVQYYEGKDEIKIRTFIKEKCYMGI